MHTFVIGSTTTSALLGVDRTFQRHVARDVMHEFLSRKLPLALALDEDVQVCAAHHWDQAARRFADHQVVRPRARPVFTGKRHDYVGDVVLALRALPWLGDDACQQTLDLGAAARAAVGRCPISIFREEGGYFAEPASIKGMAIACHEFANGVLLVGGAGHVLAP